MQYQCELFEQTAQPALSIRTRSSVDNLPQVLRNAYMEIIQYLNEIHEQPSGAPFVAYYNMDMQDLEIEVGFPVSREFPEKDKIKPSEIPTGKHASCMHIGPYSQIEPAYDALMQWAAENGHTPTGISYEFYLNDPRETPENQLQTRITFPLK
ncbi:GyrI-like domain-containing protein [Clostridiaceae bacterium 35-E11]